ncbi:MAG: cupin domain-containing protein [Pseudomonadota bacterium]
MTSQHTNKINLREKLALFDSHWDPHVIHSYNGNDVMVVKFKGEFDFHKHDNTDDFFLVLEGEVTIDYEGFPSVTFGEGEIVIIPKGVVHKPRAEKEAKLLLIQPTGSPNTGDADRKPSSKPHI